jgi:hypothetical protein
VATEDQQEEELKAVAANNNNNGGLFDDGCREEAADCELLPPHKPAAAGNRQVQNFGSLLGKRNHAVQIEELSSDDRQILFDNKDENIPGGISQIKKREQKAECKITPLLPTKELHQVYLKFSKNGWNRHGKAQYKCKKCCGNSVNPNEH